jgi:uncharacterized cupredoxin-like copper-binding protein
LTNSLSTNANVFGAALSNGDQFQVITSGVKDKANVNTLASATTNVTYSDTVAPTLVSATATAKTTTNTITLTFSEPIDVTASTVTVNGTAAVVAAGTTANQATVTVSSALTAGTTYSLSLLNFKDAAGNLTATNPITTNVTVTGDTTAPTITSVTPVRNSSVEVTFSKDMDATTLTTGSLRVLDANLTTAGGTIAEATVLPKVIDGVNSKNTFVITLTGLPYDTSNNFSGVVAYSSTIKDLSGNAIAAGTTSLSTSKDTVAPTYVSSSYNKLTTYNGIVTANGAIVVKYSKPIQLGTALPAAYTVVDDLGSTVANTINAVAVNPNDKTELVLSLTNPIATTAKTYSIVIPGTAVKDLSIETNAAASANTTVDVTAGAPVASDTTAPTVVYLNKAADTLAYAGSTIGLTIQDNAGGSGLDMSTVTNVSNYKLNGAALPSGSYITYTGTTATINIPANTITTDGVESLNVNGIKDKAGNTITPFVDTTDVTLNDDIKPVLTTETLNTSGSVSLGFSESVVPVAGTAADFTVKLNGSTLTGANLAYSLADGTGADAGKYVLSVATRHVGIAAVAGTVTGTNGVTYTGSATNVMKFTYIDVDGTGSFTAGDIVVSAVDQGNATVIADAADTTAYNLNNASTLTITTIANPSVVTDSPTTIHNLLKGSTTLVVK